MKTRGTRTRKINGCLLFGDERDPKHIGTDNVTTNVNESANKTEGWPKEKEQIYACDEGGEGKRVIAVIEERQFLYLEPIIFTNSS